MNGWRSVSVMRGSACSWSVSVFQDVKRSTLNHAGACHQRVVALAWLDRSGWDEDVQCHLGELRRKNVSDLLPRKIVNPVKHRREQRAADLQGRYENSGGQRLIRRPPSATECGGEVQTRKHIPTVLRHPNGDWALVQPL